MKRSEFLKLMSLSAAFAMAGKNPLQAAEAPSQTTSLGTKPIQKTVNGMPHRLLGRTGEYVSLLGLGGFHICLDSHTDQSAVTLMRHAIDQGVSLFENTREYNDGLAERRMGLALKGSYRDKVFLLTKNCSHDRTGKGALESLEESLRALGTDRIDLWMFHEVIYDNDPSWIVEKGGLEVALKAKAQGKVRYIGFSGHKHPSIHLDMIARSPEWDAVILPLNVFDAHFRSFEKEVLPVLNQKNIGAIAIKSLCGFMSDMLYKTGFSAEDCARYVMNLPISSLVMGSETMEQLNSNIATARNFSPLTSREIEKLLKASYPFAGDGRFERYKTTTFLDGDRGKKAHGFI